MSDAFTEEQTARDGGPEQESKSKQEQTVTVSRRKKGPQKQANDRKQTGDREQMSVEVLKKDPGQSEQIESKPPVKHVAAYCRVSTDKEEQKTSLKTQMDSFHKLIARHPGWELTEIYTDEGISGTQALHREAFTRMIADCRAGKIDRILTKNISRFARNTVECLSYVRELRKYGVSVYFEKENMDTESEVSEMVLSILAAAAQEESRSISENMKWGIRKRFAEGIVGWSPIFGYKKIDGEEYMIDPEAAPVVQRIFDEYAHGKTLSEIVKGLSADDIPCKYGGHWTPNSLAQILSNERYIGDALCQKTYVTDHITHTKVKNDQTVIPSYYIRNHHEAIVSRRTFDMVQEIRSMRDRHTGPDQYPYGGRITCPICGEKLERVVLQRCNVPAVWHCRPERGNVNCAGYYIDEKYIDEALREAYWDLDMRAVKRLAEEEVEAAEEAIRMKEELPELENVEYYFLDAMVREIRIRPWDTIEILWKCGLTSRAAIRYDRTYDIPFSPKQMSTVVAKKWLCTAAEAAAGKAPEEREKSRAKAQEKPRAKALSSEIAPAQG